MCRAEPTELEKPTLQPVIDLSAIYGQLHLSENQNLLVYNNIIYDNNIIENNMPFRINDLEVVISQTGASHAVAAQALQQNHGDIVNAIMYLENTA
jgi:NACalpha-BTF3-like transcription factor